MTTETTAHPTPGQWLAGARPRTLPAAVAPVLVGSAAAVAAGAFSIPRALLALLVALALQVGVNYANDYSDGIRGTDAERVGPVRLVGSGLARPRTVKLAAFGCFGVAALAGLALVLLTGMWWLIAVGAACIAAAWFYTGGSKPYGYLGLGELFVFVFFGLVAVCGTTLVQVGHVTVASVLGGVGVGALACALLVANNLRDIVGDRLAGKKTLATRMGPGRTQWFYLLLLVVAVFAGVAMAAATSWWALLGLLALATLIPALVTVFSGAGGGSLLRVLKATGLAELNYALGILLGVLLSRLL